MENVSFINKLKLLSDIILSSPFFLIGILVIEIALVIYMLFKRGKTEINKWFIIFTWILIFIILTILHSKVFMNLLDNFINYIFTALYFPDLSIYLIVLALSNIFFIISIIKPKMNKYRKNINIINALIIDALLIFIMDTVKENSIDVYAKLTVFSNVKLLVLLELSTGVFTSWILLNLFINLKEKLKKYDEKEYPNMPDIIFR